MRGCPAGRDAAFSYVWRERRYSDCWNYFNNGTRIHYNLTATPFTSCDCVAGFEADPDVAGPGVSARNQVWG